MAPLRLALGQPAIDGGFERESNQPAAGRRLIAIERNPEDAPRRRRQNLRRRVVEREGRDADAAECVDVVERLANQSRARLLGGNLGVVEGGA